MTIDTAAAESLRAFALEHNEIAFAHLVTAALAGEEWAVARIDAAMREWCFAPCDEDATLEVIQATDTARPDGAIAHSTVEP